MKQNRIVFFGTTKFAAEILKMLIEHGYHVVGAVSQPNDIHPRKKTPILTPVALVCQETGVPCLQPEKLKVEAQSVLDLQPDVIVTCAYGQIIPKMILSAPAIGCLNIHPSILPKYRGGAPMHYALLNGDRQTGVSLMEMVSKMDAGDVYACQYVDIADDDTLQRLEAKLLQAAKEVFLAHFDAYCRHELVGQPQDESLVTFAPNISKELEFVSFQKEAIKPLYDHIRALNDWPMAYGIICSQRIKLYEVQWEKADVQEPAGTYVGLEHDYIKIACIGGYLHLYSLQLQGKKKMQAKDFHNGVGRQLVGERFE